MREVPDRAVRMRSRRRAAAAEELTWPPLTCGRTASGSPPTPRLPGLTRRDRQPGRRTRRHRGHGRPYEGRLRLDRPLEQPPRPLGRGPREQVRHRRSGDGCHRQRQAHRARRPVPERSDRVDEGHRELPPRRSSAPALRSPPPTPPRPDVQVRSASAAIAQSRSSQPSSSQPIEVRSAKRSRGNV